MKLFKLVYFRLAFVLDYVSGTVQYQPELNQLDSTKQIIKINTSLHFADFLQQNN